MHNMHINIVYSLGIVSIDIHRKTVYNVITVKGERPQRKEVALMKFREWKQLTREQKQKAFNEYKKRVVTWGNR